MRRECHYWISSPHGNMSAMLHLPAGAGPHPAVLLVHGFTGSKSEGHRFLVKLARGLATAGVAALRVDLVGSGESEGLFEDMTFSSELDDVVAALEWMQRHYELDSSRLGCAGFSLGGALTSCATRRFSGLTGIALVSAVSEFDIWKPYGLPDQVVEMWSNLVGPGFFASLSHHRPLEAARQFPGDVLLVHGDLDAAVPVSHSHAYRASFLGARSVELQVIAGADHTYERVCHEADCQATLVSYFRRVFGLAPRNSNVLPEPLRHSDRSVCRVLAVDKLLAAQALLGKQNARPDLTIPEIRALLALHSNGDLVPWLETHAHAAGYAVKAHAPLPDCLPESTQVLAHVREVMANPLRVASFGSGMMAQAAAQEFPQATVRLFCGAQGRLLNCPANLVCENGSEAEAARAFPEHFDFVLSSFLLSSSPSYSDSLGQLASLVRRGGWLALREFVAPAELSEAETALWCESWARIVRVWQPPRSWECFEAELARCGLRVSRLGMEALPQPSAESVCATTARDLSVEGKPAEWLARVPIILAEKC